MTGTLRRLRALIRKESRQLLRDRSNVAVGIVLPLFLIVCFGYGLSLDVKDVPIAVVLEDPSPTAADVLAGLWLSPYLKPVAMRSMRDAEALMLARRIDGIVRIQPDFARTLAAGHGRIQVLVHGTDANRARIIGRYVQGAVAQWLARRSSEGFARPAAGVAVLETRQWFNEAFESRYFLVPGLIVLVMTLIGALLTALVMAREWERGTLEALFVTPVRAIEILLGKLVPYFVVGLIGLALCVLAGVYLFGVPLRGSILVLVFASMLYLLVALGFGLLISSAVKNQFLASQLALVTSFMPALMLSGFLFDLNGVPAFVRAVSTILPARYFVELLQTLYLAGNVWPLILKDCTVLAFAALVLLGLARAATQKRLG